MIDWQEAQARILALGVPVSVETISLFGAARRWAAVNVIAKRTQPARDLSAMDGYAIRFGDLPGPWRVIGESAAGSAFPGSIGTGEAARIFTGAAVPEGADTVVIQEEVGVVQEPKGLSPLGDCPPAPERGTVPKRGQSHLLLTREGPQREGAHIRRAGSDFTTGDRLISEGDAYTPATLALAAMGGHGSVDVRRRVRVAIVSTGDELVLPGTDAGDDRLPNSNAPMLAAMMAGLPVEIVDLGIVPDDRVAMRAAFVRAADCDVLVTSGGASVGDHDLVRPVLLDMDATLDFWKVAMRPGKPLMAGTLGNTIVLGLPGNPVSAFVTATLFLLPLIRYLSGAQDPLPRRIAAQCNASLPAVGPRTDFVRARWDGGALAPLPSTDSGVLSSLAQADALIIRAAGSAALPEQARVDAIQIT